MSAPSQGLISRTLFTDDPILCAAPSYFEDRARPATAEQLSRHDLLQFTSGGQKQSWRLQGSDGIWFRPQGRTRLKLEGAAALQDAALGGLGIALLPRIVVEADIDLGTLEQVLPEVNCGRITIVALYPHRRLLEPRVRLFIDSLVDAFREQPSDTPGAQKTT